MIRLLHLLAITVLIGSAAFAYSTKYETLYYSETLAKLKTKLQKERESIAIAKAEWAMLTRPDRLQKIADQHLDLQPMAISQLARLSDIPNRPNKDGIGQKLESLGLEPEATSSTSPVQGHPKPAAKRDGLSAKLDSLGLGAKPAAKPAPPKRTVQVAPPTAKPAPKATSKPAPKPAPAASQPKPAAR
ncbi:hypothetical protein [Enterovirga sp.]|uniref:cell division protein FtsL n=1 Tax=Enterovirga sp. TaxID=2026350 RepID=UPI002CB75D1F|nr:hypothetical protein [Enterovirga sp.]HMO27785.1 hypothetical protein [Enterovirga sp.]